MYSWQICQFYPFKEVNKMIQQKYKIVEKKKKNKQFFDKYFPKNNKF